MEEPLLQTPRDRGVVTLTLNRPQAFNALSEAMLAALGEAVDDPLLSAGLSAPSVKRSSSQGLR